MPSFQLVDRLPGIALAVAKTLVGSSTLRLNRRGETAQEACVSEEKLSATYVTRVKMSIFLPELITNFWEKEEAIA